MHRAARHGERADPGPRPQRQLLLQRRQRGPAERQVRAGTGVPTATRWITSWLSPQRVLPGCI